MPAKRRLRPEFNLKDFSILFDYSYASLWTRWRRGYELYMYASQAYVGLNYSFKYFVTGRPGAGVGLPGVCYMYPSTEQDMAMRMVAIRPRDTFRFLDFGYAIDTVTPAGENLYAVKLTSNFGAPVSFFEGEVLSDRFDANGVEKTTYNNYTVVGVGANNLPMTPSFLPIFNTLFISTSIDNSWTVIDETTLAAPAQSLPTPGEFFTTEMRFACNCPDYLGREDFNLYKYNLKRRYPYTRPQDLKPGSYDVGVTYDPNRVAPSRDLPGFTRDFGFLYVKRVLDLPDYRDDARTYSDPNMFYYAPRWCKHIYASFWDMQNRLGKGRSNFPQPWLSQPTDEPLDSEYREYFERNLHKQTTFNNRQENLRWWQRYSPSKDNVPVHMMYPDMHPTMVKALNVDTLGSGVTSPLTASGFQIFDLDEFNPFDPTAPGTEQVFDGGTYSFGVLGSGVADLYDGGTYSFGTLVPPPVQPSNLNGGTY